MKITLDTLQSVARSLGFDPQWITEMRITTDEITVTYTDPKGDLGEDGALITTNHTYFVSQ